MYYIPLWARHVVEFGDTGVNIESLHSRELCCWGRLSLGHSGVDESRAQPIKANGGGHSVERLER